MAACRGQVHGVCQRSEADNIYRLPSSGSAATKAFGRSMGRVGSSYNNALPGFVQGLKCELFHGYSWTSKAHTRFELFRWTSDYNLGINLNPVLVPLFGRAT